MSDPITVRRQLKIKSGVVNRVFKEHNLYRVEAEQQQKKLDKLVADAAEDWDIKNARKIMEESEKMIKDVDLRMAKAVGELRDLLVKVREDPTFAEDEEFLKAEESLETASA